MNSSVFDSFPTLTSERLLLRKLVQADFLAMKEIIEGRPLGNDITPAELLKQVDHDFGGRKAITWGIEWEGVLVGTCGYYRGFADDVGEIGFVMRPGYRRKGIMREAVQIAMDFGYNGMALRMITAYTRDDNPATIAMIIGLDFSKTEVMSDLFRRYEHTPSLSAGI